MNLILKTWKLYLLKYSNEEVKIDRLDEASECVAKDAPIDKYSVLDIEESNLEEDVSDLNELFLFQSAELEYC